jgi:hypothetical protein
MAGDVLLLLGMMNVRFRVVKIIQKVVCAHLARLEAFEKDFKQSENVWTKYEFLNNLKRF